MENITSKKILPLEGEDAGAFPSPQEMSNRRQRGCRRKQHRHRHGCGMESAMGGGMSMKGRGKDRGNCGNHSLGEGYGKRACGDMA